MKRDFSLCQHWDGAQACPNFQALFDQSAVAMLLLDPVEGQIVDCNAAAVQLYGYSRDQLQTMQIGQINQLPKDELEKELKAAREQSRDYFCFRHRLANGEIRDVEVSSGPVNVQGHSLLFSIIHDVSRRNRAERAFQARSEAGLAILRANSEQEILAETCRVIVEVAGYTYSWVGYALNDAEKRIEPQTAVGIELAELEKYPTSWDIDAPTGQGPCGNAVRTGQPQLENDLLNKAPHHKRAFLEQHSVNAALALPLKNGVHILGVLVIAAEGQQSFTSEEVSLLKGLADTVSHGIDALRHRDKQKRLEQRLIWERDDLMRAQRELQDVNEQLRQAQSQMVAQEKLASVGHLAAGVAHEVNNPTGFIASNLGSLRKYMGRIRQYLEAEQRLLAEKVPVEERRELDGLRKKLKINFLLEDIDELIDESEEGTDRIRGIVQDLKTFARNDGDAMVPTNLNECLESTINIAWNEIKYKAELVRELGDVPLLTCNAQKLNQVFMNLLVNAAHAIQEQGTIRVRTWSDPQNIYVGISDDGCGMTPDVQKKIFEPFFTTKDVGKGTGLGMSIAMEIVKKHGGEIQLQSQPGEGTTFTLVLPRNDEPTAAD